MNKKVSLGTALSIIILVVAVTFATTFVISMNFFNSKIKNLNERENMFQKVQEIDSVVRNNFYDDITEKDLINSICSGYVAGLSDKYSYYMTAEQYNRLKQNNSGSLVGIGIVISKDPSGYFKIESVYKDSPAEAVGLLSEDLIVKIGDEDTAALTLEGMTERINGEIGTKVKLTVRTSGEQKELEVVRRKIEIPSVEYKSIGDFGYIRITEFNAATVAQFKNALSEVTKAGNTGIVFDVRNNTGGTLDATCQILDELLPEGPIVSAMYKDSTEKTVLYTSGSGEVRIPMTVLVNENTASAAELFACALKDYDKAYVVGSTTYGKGVMQTTYQLSDGSAVIITTGKFYPPKSDNFNGVGVKPNYDVALSPDQSSNLSKLDETNDPQLIKAMEVLASENNK